METERRKETVEGWREAHLAAAREAYDALNPYVGPEILRLLFPISDEPMWMPEGEEGHKAWASAVYSTWDALVYQLRAEGYQSLLLLREALRRRLESGDNTGVVAFRRVILDSVLWHYEVLGYVSTEGEARTAKDGGTPAGQIVLLLTLTNPKQRLAYIREEVMSKGETWAERYHYFKEFWEGLQWPSGCIEPFPYVSPESMAEMYNRPRRQGRTSKA